MDALTVWRQYGAAAIIDGVSLRTRDANRDLVATDILVAGDVTVSKTGGATANLATLPVQEPASSGLWRVELSAAEMTSPRTVVKIVDQTVSKAFADAIIIVETYGDTDAEHGVDFTRAGDTFNAQLLVGTATNRIVSVAEDMARYAARSWYIDFLIAGEDSTAWDAFTFSLKLNPSTDSDDEAALVVRVTNPAAGTDGVVRYLGGAADGTIQAWGAIVVDGVNPTDLSVHVLPGATDLPPGSYTWELTRYRDADADPLGSGKMTVLRGVRRGPAAP